MAAHVHDAVIISGRHDGCATFYRCGKFDKVATRTIEFDELSKDLISTDVSDNVPDFATHNVALVTVLRPKGRWGTCLTRCAMSRIHTHEILTTCALIHACLSRMLDCI